MAPTINSERHIHKLLTTFLMPTTSLRNFTIFTTTLSTVVKKRDKPMKNKPVILVSV
jgi:hypothetical protein